MKVDARRAEALLRDPSRCRVLLLHGEDAGLVHARAEAATRAVLGAAEDPFRLTWLGRDAAARLPAEAAAMPLTGGRMVVRVREAGDALATPLQAALDGPGQALIVLEAGELPTRSRLRALVERHADGASIGCYPEEGRTLEEAIRATLAARQVRVEPEAVAWLRAHLGADHAATRMELEKLALYVGDGGAVDLAAAQAATGDVADVSLEDALFAATAGDRAGMDRALSVALSGGASPVSVVRAAMIHGQRLHRVRLAMERDGIGAEDAVRLARPPLFFRRTGAFAAALSRWNPAALLRALQALAQAERDCKRTGAPDEVICRRVLSSLCDYAAARRVDRS